MSDRAYLSYAACMATVDRAVEAARGAGAISSTAVPAAGAVLSATSACRRGVTPLAVRATSSGGARADVLRSAPPAPLKVTCTRRADGRLAVRLVSRRGPLRRIVGPRLRIGALRPSDTPGGGLITFRFDRG